MSFLLSTTGLVGVSQAAGLVPRSLPLTYPTATTEINYRVTLDDLGTTTQIIEVEPRLIPVDADCRLYDVVVGGVTYTLDWGTGIPIDVVVGIYTLSFGEWGYVTVSYDPAEIANLPADDTVGTLIATITNYRVATVVGTMVSGQYGPVNVTLDGKTTAADTTNPTLVNVTPSGVSVGITTPIVISCDEPMAAGTGTFTLWNATAGSVFETINVATAPTSGPGSILYSGSTITVTPTNARANSTDYSVRWLSTAFTDLAGNPLAGVTDDTWGFTTIPSSGSGGGSFTPDSTSSTVAGIQAILDSWEANWSGTVPSGKTVNDERVVGLNASTSGAFNLNNYSFPQRVYIRHVGTYNGDLTCSVVHNGSGTINNSNNLILYRMYITCPDAGAYNLGHWQINNSNGCGAIKCSLNGYPFNRLTQNSGTTSYFCTVTGGSNIIFQHNVYRYYNDGFWKPFGTITNLHNEGNIGIWIGGDDYTIAAGCNLVDPVFRCNFYCRDRAKDGGQHADGIQFNGNGVGAIATRWYSEYDVMLRGVWTGAIANPGETGWGGYFMSNSSATSLGPHYYKHCLFVNGHNRAVTTFAGGNNNIEYMSCIQHDNHQPPNAGWPYVRGGQTVTGNFCTAPNAGYNTQIGTGGYLLVMGGNNDGTGANFSLLLPFCTNIPTSFTDLWDMRPPSGAITHPNHTPSNERVGCWQLWEKLFNGDSDIVLSKQGWPVAKPFIDYYDRGDNFWGGFTNTYDSSGDNL